MNIDLQRYMLPS